MNSYYGKEEETETPETQLDNYRAQSGASEAVTIWAREEIANIYDQTLGMWNKAGEMREAAEARGDMQAVESLTLLQNNLTEVYQGTEHLQQALLHSNAEKQGILEATQALVKQKKEVEEEYGTLLDAIEQVDYEHPALQPLIELIEEDVYEMVSEQAFEGAEEEAAEAAFDGINSDICRTIRAMAPLAQYSYSTIVCFVMALKGDMEMNDIQRGLLLSLVNTFVAESKAS